jgi:hypothetical protein
MLPPPSIGIEPGVALEIGQKLLQKRELSFQYLTPGLGHGVVFWGPVPVTLSHRIAAILPVPLVLHPVPERAGIHDMPALRSLFSPNPSHSGT